MRKRSESRKEQKVESQLLKRARDKTEKQIEKITTSHVNLRNNVQSSLCNLKQDSSPEEFRQAVYSFVKYQYSIFAILHDAIKIYEDPEAYKEKIFKQLNKFNALLLQALERNLHAEDLRMLQKKLLSVNEMEPLSSEEKACYFFIYVESWSRQYTPENAQRKCDFSSVSRNIFDFLISILGEDFSSSISEAHAQDFSRSAKKSRIEPEPTPEPQFDFLFEAKQDLTELELLELEEIDSGDFELDTAPVLPQNFSFVLFKPKTKVDNIDEFQIGAPLPMILIDML
jgi:hypothetical protein